MQPRGEAVPDRDGERNRAREPRSTDELDRLVDRGVLGHVGEAELICAEPQRGANGRVELAHRALTERVNRMVEGAHSLHGAEGEALRERAVAAVEARGRAAESTIRVRVFFEDA